MGRRKQSPVLLSPIRMPFVRVLSATLLSLSSFAFAQVPLAPGTLAKPDFSGRWKMDKAQSDFGNFKVPDIVVRTVDEHASAMNVHTVQTSGDRTSIIDATYNTDGSVAKNVINGRDAESKSFWDGDVLVIRTNMKTAKGLNEEIIDRWKLSDDKNTMTIESHVDTDNGGADMKMVCVRQQTAP